MQQDQLQMKFYDGARPGVKVVALDGVLNCETAFRFRDFVRRYDPAGLIVDMTLVRSLDSSGLGVLIGLYVSFDRSCKPLMLVGINDRIWDLIRLCKIEDVFTRYATIADAERALPQSAESIAST